MFLMQVSRRVEYALRAAIHLARQTPGRSASVAEISASEAIPKKFLEKILQDLIHADLVVSRRGAHGGYTLSRAAARISFKDVLEAVEGPIALNVCVEDRTSCSVSPTCGMHHVWAEGQRRVIELFAATKLADLVPPDARRRGGGSEEGDPATDPAGALPAAASIPTGPV